MDTKSKRFDKLSIIRLVCIVMSLVFIVTASVKILGFISFVEENEVYDELEDIAFNFLSGHDKNENMFQREFDIFIDNALSKGLLYSSHTEKGYKEYLKKCTDKYGEDFISALLYNRQLGTDYLIFYSLDKGYINLNKIDDIAYNPASAFFYNDGTGYREIYDEEYGHYFEFSDYDEYVPDEDSDDFETTMPYTEPHTEGGSGSTSSRHIYRRSDNISYPVYADACYEMQYDNEDYSGYIENTHGTKYHSDISYTNKNAINSSKADALVMIEDAYFGKTHYSGIYEVTLNKDKLDIFSKESFVSSIDFSESTREDFSENFKRCDEKLKEYKNAFYAVLDESTGNFTTNLKVTKEKASPDNIEEMMKKISTDYLKFSSGVYSYSKSPLASHVVSFIDNYRENLSSDAAFTVWVAFDSTLSGGADPFTHIDNSLAVVEGQLETALPAVIVCVLGWLICLVVLIFLTGRRSYDSDLYMSRFDGIFTILRTAINLGLSFLVLFGAFNLIFVLAEEANMSYSHIMTGATKTVCCIAVLFVSLLITDWVLYIARHIKNRSLLKNISVVKLAFFLHKKSKERKAERLLHDEKYEDFRKKILSIIIPVLTVVNIIIFFALCLLSDHHGGEVLLLFPLIFAAEVLAAYFLIKYVTGARDIFQAIHRMREGETQQKLDKSKLPTRLRAYAEDINYVGDGLSYAVEKATKEQRTKTELITNVSHDLKTPLTSIINYVDLLSKRPIEDEEARKYIAVLGEKSGKLKKLIEDLVEASKASAGNVPVNFMKLNLHELVSQVVGEYEDDFDSRLLSVIVEEKESDVTVTADSKLASRVLDNLMINVRKYALPNTRVYIRIFRKEGFGCISISNISSQQLNIPVSELKERFVRGDESRSGEGSGLGLAIAEDFMSLQQGRLELEINGDMFTAAVMFKES